MDMVVFLKSESMDIWQAVKDGPFVPTKLVEGRKVKKPIKEWNDHDNRIISYNHNSMHIFYFSFNKIQQFENAQEIWITLEIAYEGTSQVKEKKYPS